MITIEFEGEVRMPVTVKAEIEPGRPAPMCSNPDDPRFADPGDPLEIVRYQVFLNGNDITSTLTCCQEDEIERQIMEDEWL